MEDLKVQDSIAVKYRPKKLDDFVGNAQNISVIKGFFNQRKLVKTWLFSGESGSGKTSIARLIAMTVNCQDLQGIDPCMKCASCKAALSGSHPDIHEFNAAGDAGNVDSLRKTLSMAKLSPYFGWRCFILDECHSMSPKGKQEILKPLEEPPAKTMWMLCTTEPEKLADATYGRCLKLFFTYPTVDDLSERLRVIAKREYDKEVYLSLKPYLSMISEGVGCQPRNAISTLELVASALHTDAELSKKEIKQTIKRFLLYTGELDGLVLKFLLYLSCNKKLEPLKIASKIEDSRVEEFLSLVHRYSHYSILYLLHKQDKSRPDKQGFFGVPFIRLEQSLDKIERKVSDNNFFQICASVTNAIEKIRTGLLAPRQAVIYLMNDYFRNIK